MKVIGIDPGSNITGYGVVEEKSDRLFALDWGRVRPPPKRSFAEKLKVIHEDIEKIIHRHRPDVVAVEDMFFAENVKSAVKLGHARGVAILAAARHDIQVEEYTPLEIKQSIVGYGRADKNQVRDMLCYILNLDKNIKGTDASDALAVAVCHLHSARIKNMINAI